MPNQIEKQIGQYLLEEKIGSGATATVFRAVREDSDERFAVKVLSETLCENEVARGRFQREIEMLQKLAHPAIIPIVDFGEVNGRLYIVMPFMSGGNLRRKALDHSLTLADCAAILSQIAPAIDAAHAQKIIHRDVKPQNILLDADGNAYLSDFGVARLLHPEAKSKTMTLIGTPEFMAPEQVMQGRLTAQSDIYQLGIALYFMLTQQYPFRGNAMEVMSQQVRSAVPPVRAQRFDLPEGVDLIIAKATSKLPRLRYETAAEMAADLQAVAAGILLAPPLPATAEWTSVGDENLPPTLPPEAVLAQPAPPAAPPTRRNGRRWAAFGSVGVLGTLFVGLFALFALPLDGGGRGQNGLVENVVEVVDDAVDDVADVVDETVENVVEIVDEVTAVNQPAVVQPIVESIVEANVPAVDQSVESNETVAVVDDAEPENDNTLPAPPPQAADNDNPPPPPPNGNGNGGNGGDGNGGGNRGGGNGGNGDGNNRPPRGGGNGGG